MARAKIVEKEEEVVEVPTVTCTACEGTGLQDADTLCPECNGNGKV